VYNLKNIIGRGEFSYVKLANLISNPEKQVAIKIIEKKNLKQN